MNNNKQEKKLDRKEQVVNRLKNKLNEKNNTDNKQETNTPAIQFNGDINAYMNTGIVPKNKMADEMMSKMSPEELEEYKKYGEHMYGKFNYEKGMPTDEYKNAVLYIKMALMSGLNYDNFNEDEVKFMEEEFGKEWYNNWEELLLDF